MKNIPVTELNKALKSLIGKTAQVKPSSPALFIFFGGNSETCESNFYTMEDWEIFQKDKLILKKDKQDTKSEKEISKLLKNQELANISVAQKGMELNIGQDFLIKINNTGYPRTWEIRLKKDELFFAATGSGEFSQATYKNSQII